MPKEPIYREDCWKCPECGWLNPNPNYVIDVYPPITCYRCRKCKYHYDYQPGIPKSVLFGWNYPEGREDK